MSREISARDEISLNMVAWLLAVPSSGWLAGSPSWPHRNGVVAVRCRSIDHQLRAVARSSVVMRQRPPDFSDDGTFNAEMFKYYANPETFENTALTITEFPNPVLRAVNADVTEFDDALQKQCSEFFSVMYGANGVGLAAPQVGLSIRLFVYNCDPTAPGALRKLGERVVANPKIIEYCQATEVDIEGCLSSRSECCRGDIRRAKELQVEYQDERGRVKKKKLRGFEARVFQHEFDHLEGVLHIDRQCPSDRKRIQPFLDVLVEQHGPGGVLEPRQEVVTNLIPPPIVHDESAAPAPAPAPPPKPVAKSPAAAKGKATVGSTGAGSGGFGGGGAGKGQAKKKKKKR